MSVTVTGNHGVAFRGQGSRGNGALNIPVGMGWLCATASAPGDELVVQLSSILGSNDINQGIFFQSDAGATVTFTLGNPGNADSNDPLVNAGVTFANSLSVPSG